MTFTPYLHFQGNCAEAMQFYAEVFGATDLAISRFSEAPPEVDMPRSDRVMHATLTMGDHVLYASDFPDGLEGDPQKAVSVSFEATDAAQAKAIYDRFMETGDEIMAFQETFFSPGFGMVRDQFGTHWMISAPLAA